MHIVEELIAERAVKLRSHKWLWAMLRPYLYTALGYARAVEMADIIAPMNGRETFDYVSAQIGINISTAGKTRIPRTGPLIIVCNHPTGLADGLFMHKALSAIRPHHLYLANADALRVIPKGDDIIIPVEWVTEKRTPAKTKATLSDMKAAIKAGKCIVIFPSGGLAARKRGQMVEKPWMHTAAAFARKHGVPIIPAHIRAQNSYLFYIFDALNRELKDITLFREMLNKGKITPHITFGPLIKPESLPKKSIDATQELKAVVEVLGDYSGSQ